MMHDTSRFLRQVWLRVHLAALFRSYYGQHTQVNIYINPLYVPPEAMRDKCTRIYRTIDA